MFLDIKTFFEGDNYFSKHHISHVHSLPFIIFRGTPRSNSFLYFLESNRMFHVVVENEALPVQTIPMGVKRMETGRVKITFQNHRIEKGYF